MCMCILSTQPVALWANALRLLIAVLIWLPLVTEPHAAGNRWVILATRTIDTKA